MNIRVMVHPTIEHNSTIVEMIRRVRGLERVQDVSMADGVITDDPGYAAHAMGDRRYVLLLSPFQVDVDSFRAPDAIKKMVPAFHGRCRPWMHQIKTEIDAGNLGVPGLLRVHDWGHTLGLSDQRLAEQLDIATWCFGQLPSVVYALARLDHYQVHLGFKGDGMAILNIDAGESLGANYRSLHLIGSRGAVYADDHDNVQLAISAQGIRAIIPTQEESTWVNVLQGFQEVMRLDDCQQSAWRQVLAIQRLVSAVHESVQRRQPIVLEQTDE